MAHHEDERTTMHGVLDMLVEQGLEGMAEAMATIPNEAMKIERSTALRAEPGERSSFQRNAQADLPKLEMKRPAANDIRAIFNEPTV